MFCNGLHCPDLNPMKNLWSELKRGYPSGINDSEKVCMEEWSKIPPNVFSNHFTNYRKRLMAVIFTRGVCTTY